MKAATELLPIGTIVRGLFTFSLYQIIGHLEPPMPDYMLRLIRLPPMRCRDNTRELGHKGHEHHFNLEVVSEDEYIMIVLGDL